MYISSMSRREPASGNKVVTLELPIGIVDSVAEYAQQLHLTRTAIYKMALQKGLERLKEVLIDA